MKTEMATDREPQDKSETEPTTCAALGQPSATDLPDIGNKPNQSRRYQFLKRFLGRKILCIIHSNPRGSIDGSGFITILPEIWPSVLPV